MTASVGWLALILRLRHACACAWLSVRGCASACMRVCVCLQVYRNMVDAARGIVAARGMSGLYAGLGVTVIEIMPYAALQFGLYDTLQDAWAAAKVRGEVHEGPEV